MQNTSVRTPNPPISWQPVCMNKYEGEKRARIYISYWHIAPYKVPTEVRKYLQNVRLQICFQRFWQVIKIFACRGSLTTLSTVSLLTLTNASSLMQPSTNSFSVKVPSPACNTIVMQQFKHFINASLVSNSKSFVWVHEEVIAQEFLNL